MIKPYYESNGIVIYHGDCRKILPQIGLVETCITDPPYGLEFMGKDWDRCVPGLEFWRLIAEALKPGSLALAFGGTRTFHRLACAIEDAGFEIRDCMMWLYGSGFPKSLDISKAIDKTAGAKRKVVGRRAWSNAKMDAGKGVSGLKQAGSPAGGYEAERINVPITTPATAAAKQWSGWGSALKPAWEPVIVAMKPLDGTFADNAQNWGVAGLNVDGCRVSPAQQDDYGRSACGKDGIKKAHAGFDGKSFKIKDREGSGTSALGRWPANLILDERAGAMLDAQSGDSTSRSGKPRKSRKAGDGWGMTKTGAEYDDIGGASRFFYTAKASGSERNDGYDVRNKHPTVKPLELIRYLCKLTATPASSTVLDPFMGSGTTLVAARDMGRRAIGIEIEERWCEVAVKRLSQEVLFGQS